MNGLEREKGRKDRNTILNEILIYIQNILISNFDSLHIKGRKKSIIHHYTICPKNDGFN